MTNTNNYAQQWQPELHTILMQGAPAFPFITTNADSDFKGDTGATGPQGPAGSNYVLTAADRQAIAQTEHLHRQSDAGGDSGDHNGRAG